MRLKNLVVGLLIITLSTQLTFPSTGIAGPPRLQRPSLALLVLEADNPSPKGVAFATKTLKELRQERDYKLIPPNQISWATSLFNHESDGRRRLAPVVTTASDDYDNLRLFEGQSSLGRALEDIREGACVAEDYFYLVPANILMAKTLLPLEQRKEALRFAREALRLSPSLFLNEVEYPPKVRKLFNEAREERQATRTSPGVIQVTSSPKGSKVYLDGEYRGTTAVTLRDLPPGPHYLSLIREGYQPACKRVTVTAGGWAPVAISLTKGESKKPFPTLRVRSLNRQEEITRRAALVGRLVGSDLVLLVHFEETGLRPRASAQLIEVSSVFGRERLLAKKGLETDDPEEVAGELVKGVLGDGVRVAEEEGFHPWPPPKREKEEKPIWKRPVFWIIGGLILAGAGAGMAVGLGGGGGGEASTSISIDTPTPGGLRR